VNDQQQPYGPYDRYDGYGQPRIVGYDEYGQPVYEQPPGGGAYDSYGREASGGHAYGGQPEQGAGYDPYAQQPYPGQAGGQPPRPAQYDPYAQQPGPYGTHGHEGADTGTQPTVGTGQWAVPRQEAGQPLQAPQDRPAQQPLPPRWPYPGGQSAHVPAPRPGAAPPDGGRTGPLPDAAEPGRDYRTEQFSFVEEPDEISEDVIDWLKFTESRSERREEAKRRGKRRIVALVVVLALAVVGGAGYLWYAGKLPGLGGGTAARKQAVPVGAQKRDVIVVHLHDVSSKETSTALLVNNETTGQGTTVLLPNALALPNDDGTTTTLGASVDDDGSDGTRQAIGTLLGTKVSGTWRLDTPYLENLVDLVGSIDVDTDVAVPDSRKGAEPVVPRGRDESLSGKMAVAYATYRAPGESQDAQLTRFGQVLQAVLRKMSSDPKDATVTVQTLAQILDPALTDQDLGTALAHLAEHAKNDDYTTTVLPVQKDGTLSTQATDDVVKKVLGGSLGAPAKGGPVSISVKDGSGRASTTESARISLVNAGYTYVDGGSGAVVPTSTVTYAQDKNKDQAIEVAKTLGLPSGAVRKASGAGDADVTVVLGADYKPRDFKTGQ
jgi:anionic cell wall polymer biosynthesis LytR-Cps2A-Psr (LCP) family protein